MFRPKPIVASLAALAVCGAAPAVAMAASKTAKTASTPYKITFVAALVNDSYFVTIKCGAEAEAKHLGVDLTWTGPTTNSAATEIQAVSAAALTDPDGMIIAPFSNTGFSGEVGPLMAKGVPVIASGETLSPSDALATYITDFKLGGNSLAAKVKALTGGTGTMAIVADDTGNTTDSDRYTGLIPILKKQDPKLTVLKPQYAQNSTAMGASVTASLITGNPDLKLVYATTGPEAVGAASAIAAAHDTGKIKLISFDSSPPQITLLKRGQLAATIAQSPFLDGELTVKSIYEYLKAHPNGGPVKASAKLDYTPQKLLTPSNVTSAVAKQYEYLTSCANAPTSAQ
jgi:ribose transport system substrate-binding protein